MALCPCQPYTGNKLVLLEWKKMKNQNQTHKILNINLLLGIELFSCKKKKIELKAQSFPPSYSGVLEDLATTSSWLYPENNHLELALVIHLSQIVNPVYHKVPILTIFPFIFIVGT